MECEWCKLAIQNVRFLFLGALLPFFSAHHSWTAPRKVEMKKSDGQEFGFSIRGDSPVIVAAVDTGSLAEVNDLSSIHNIHLQL